MSMPVLLITGILYQEWDRAWGLFRFMELPLAGSDSADRPSLGVGVNFLEPRLSKSHTTVVIPLHDRIVFVSSLDGPEFASRLSEVAQTFDPISGIQFLISGRWVGEPWLLGTV